MRKTDIKKKLTDKEKKMFLFWWCIHEIKRSQIELYAVMIHGSFVGVKATWLLFSIFLIVLARLFISFCYASGIC